jgi:hypothetical protein
MLSAYRLPISFEPRPLQSEIATALQQSRWIDHWADGVAAPGTWTVLTLVAGAGDLDDGSTRLGSDTAPRPTAMLAQLPKLRAAIETFQTTLLRARLMRLKAGASIGEHRDFGYFSGRRWSFERGRIRVHIPIVTDHGVRWKLNGHDLTMAADEAWYVNVCLPHSVENRSANDRINLVLELEVNDWLRNLFPPQNWRERMWSATLRQVEPRIWKVTDSWMQRRSGAPVGGNKGS